MFKYDKMKMNEMSKVYGFTMVNDAPMFLGKEDKNCRISYPSAA